VPDQSIKIPDWQKISASQSPLPADDDLFAREKQSDQTD